MSGLTNAQADEAEQIKSLMAESEAAHRISVDKALEAGLRLIEAKSACAHGTWLPFLKRVGVQERKAQRLMKLAQSGLKSDTVTDLGGIKGALAFVSIKDKAVKLFQSLEYRGWSHVINVDGTVNEEAAKDIDIAVMGRDVERLSQAIDLVKEASGMFASATERSQGWKTK